MKTRNVILLLIISKLILNSESEKLAVFVCNAFFFSSNFIGLIRSLYHIQTERGKHVVRIEREKHCCSNGNAESAAIKVYNLIDKQKFKQSLAFHNSALCWSSKILVFSLFKHNSRLQHV